MSQSRPESAIPRSSLTPWVGRVMVANAVVLLLLQTVFTAPTFVAALEFTPGQAFQRPWTLFSYMFVHEGVFHLAANLLLLSVFGPVVERRLGGRAFLLYYLYCGVGAAAFALGLTSFMAVHPMIGASGPALGMALAFAVIRPDAELTVFPPLRLSARAVVILLAGMSTVLALWIDAEPMHLGYLGGIAAGYLFFRINTLVEHRQKKEPKAISRRPVMAPIPVRQGGSITDVRPALARPEPREEYPVEEVDRVLDKISAFGIQSLTPEERRFLDEVSKRKRTDLH